MMARIIIWSSLLLLPLFGFSQWSQPGDRYAYEFDGSSSIIQIANESLFDAANSVVVELDLWFDDVTSSGYKGIVAKRDGVSNVTNFAINYQGSTNQFQWYFNDGSGFYVHVLALRTYFQTDTWYHVKLSFTKNGSNVDSEIVIDGGTPITTTFAGKSLGSNNVPVTIGNSFVGSSQWHPGKVDNIKITIDGKTTAYYLFEDGSGTTLTDRLGNADGTITGGGTWYNKYTPPPPIFSPLDIDSLVVWLEANDVDGDGNIGNNSGVYSTWIDKSGNANNFTAESGMEPTYVSGALNGHAGLNFSTSDNMRCDSIASLNTNDEYAIFIVAESDISLNYQVLFTLATDLSFSTILIRVFSNNIWESRTKSTVLDVIEITKNPSFPFVMSYQLNLSDQTAFKINDTSGAGSADFSPTQHIFFRLSHPNATEEWDGNIHEVLVYSKTLTSEEITNVENYLTIKYGL